MCVGVDGGVDVLEALSFLAVCRRKEAAAELDAKDRVDGSFCAFPIVGVTVPSAITLSSDVYM